MKNNTKKLCLYNDLDQILLNDNNYSGFSFSYSFDNIDYMIINDVEYLLHDTDCLTIESGKNHLYFVINTEKYSHMFRIEYRSITNFLLGESNVYK